MGHGTYVSIVQWRAGVAWLAKRGYAERCCVCLRAWTTSQRGMCGLTAHHDNGPYEIVQARTLPVVGTTDKLFDWTREAVHA